MATIANLYPLLKEMGLDDEKSRDFIETIEESYQGRIEQEIKHLVTKEDLIKEISNLKVEMIKWAIGLLLGQTAVILTILRLFFIK